MGNIIIYRFASLNFFALYICINISGASTAYCVFVPVFAWCHFPTASMAGGGKLDLDPSPRGADGSPFHTCAVAYFIARG